jgi:hypothetical protein
VNSSDQLAFELGVEEERIMIFLKSLNDLHWIKEKDRQLWIITEKGGVWLRNIENAKWDELLACR